MRRPNRVLIVGICFVGFLFLTKSAAEGRAEERPSDIVVFDVWNYFETAGITNSRAQADVLYLLTSLQGIVNREEPRLYLLLAYSLFDLQSRYRGTPELNTAPVTELDEFWLDWFQEKGWIKPDQLVRLQTLEEVIARYQNEINGLVRWDTFVGATLNAALMAAGAENLLPVSDSLATGRLAAWMQQKFPNLGLELDLSGRFHEAEGEEVRVGSVAFESCGSPKNDVYRFAIERFLKTKKLNPARMWYNCDGYIWSAPGRWKEATYSPELYGRLGERAQFQQNGLFNTDYWVSQKAVFLDLYPWNDSAPTDEPDQKFGQDLKTWHEILGIAYEQRDGCFGVVGGFIPWWVKYSTVSGNPHKPVPGEWRFIQLITSYNMVNDGDAAFGISNASFFQHMPQISRKNCKWEYPKPMELEPGTTYLAIMMMDYDGSAWLNQAAVSIYRDPARGKLPLNWCINPILNERVPHAFQYMVEHRTDQDFFGIANDGVGYLSPYYLESRQRFGTIQKDGLKVYEKFARDIRRRYGYHYNAFYITTDGSPGWLDMCARLNPEGFGVHYPNPPESFNDVPLAGLRPINVPQAIDGQFAEKLGHFYHRASLDGPENYFAAWRCILVNPTQVLNAVEETRAKYPDANVKIVDWPNYLRLKKQWLEKK